MFKGLSWFRKTFTPDVMAGLTVALVSIPAGMAHTLVAAEIIEEAGIEEAKQVLLAALMMEDQDGG